MRRPTLLIVLDGWGHREAVEHNAIRAEARCFQELQARYPSTLLSASGEEVGLPLGLMGNSEVGHTNLGAGRTVWQEITRIDRAIREGGFFTNPALLGAVEGARRRNATLHLLGLVSDGGVHASDQHLRSLLELARRAGLGREQVMVHAILDGRDTPPRSGARYVAALEQDLERAGVGRIASVVGRYWAMDRDKRWERVQRAYDLFTGGVGSPFASAGAALQAAYAKEVGDEFVEPCPIARAPAARLRDGDALLCFNFRADRMRQICTALSSASFDGFPRAAFPRLEIATMTQYRADFPFPVAFPPQELKGSFGEIVSASGLRQERIAETEKYAHVTFFFSCGREAEFPHESRVLVPSPKVATYDLQPEMSAPEVTAAILRSLERGETDAYVINFANADMVGHTGIESAARAAVRAVDQSLAAIVPVVTRKGGLVAITADHGNAEEMWDVEHDQPHTAHTTNPVPIVLCAEDLRGVKLRKMGILADVAPTLCALTDIPRSSGMDGLSLLE
ncbi:MAG TPA: 2,3-bisphosphoglycerate-independent phosphoglycerate mutase [Planctomycetota bacterium]